MSKSSAFTLTHQIIFAMLLGALVGYCFGPAVAGFGALGKLIIQLIKALAVPLVFFAIVDALITTHIPAKSALRLLTVTTINAFFAASIGLMLSNIFQPGSALNFVDMTKGLSDTTIKPFADRKLELAAILSGYVPESLFQPFHDNNIIAVVIIAVLIGAAGRRICKNDNSFQITNSVLFFVKLFEQILIWLVHLVPIAVFGVMCKTVGEYGFKPFVGLSIYVAVALLGMFIQIVLIYQAWIALFAKIPLRTFWREAKSALVYAFGVNSSLATLPLTLKVLDNLKISKAASRLGACVGTNLNNDGILLYEAMAVLFVAQAHGIDLSFYQQITTALLCVVAAAGVAGVPEAGVISLSLVLATIGLPLEILPLLLTVDWLVARARSVTNALADMTVSIALNRLEGAGARSN